MKIGVLTCTRDRLDYTKHCFASLKENAGVEFDHYVFDNGSTDGTAEWLTGEYAPAFVRANTENIGIHRAMNYLIDAAKIRGRYDLLVTVDNDCEVTTPGTLLAVAEATLSADRPRVVSPLIEGLRHRPSIFQTEGRFGKTRVVGQVFRSIPPQLLEAGFRYDESLPVWGGDENHMCDLVYRLGGDCGFLLDYPARHYRTTLGQVEEMDWYFRRRESEGGPYL